MLRSLKPFALAEKVGAANHFACGLHMFGQARIRVKRACSSIEQKGCAGTVMQNKALLQIQVVSKISLSGRTSQRPNPVRQANTVRFIYEISATPVRAMMAEKTQ